MKWSEFDVELGRGDVLLYLTVRADVGKSYRGDYINSPHGPEIDIKEVIVVEALSEEGDVVAPFKGEKITLTDEESKVVYERLFEEACNREADAARYRDEARYADDE